MGRRIAAIAGILSGLALVIGTFAMGGFGAASDGEDLIDRARPVLTGNGLTDLRADFTEITTAGSEVTKVVVPAYAQAEGMTPAQFAPVFQSRYPALAAAGAEAPSTLQLTDRTIANLERHQRDFEAADGIPTSYIPLDVAPALTLVLGLMLLVAGGLALRPAMGRAPVIAVLVVGALIVAFTLGAGLFRKTRAAHSLASSLTITKASAADTGRRFAVQKAGAAELDQRVFPDLQAKLGLANPQFDDWLRARAPHAAALRGRFVAAVDRFGQEQSVREHAVTELASVRDVPVENIPWFYLVVGLVALTGGAVGLALGWRRAEVGATPPAAVTAPAV